ncbi:hypothetical protein KQI72_11190 [Eubacterium sp. MSJ-21]|nr:hypothetical protein [Eubacterium sp. MSJ-21]
MKKKSILPLVTVTMLATALLGGCANKADTTTSTGEATPTEAVKEGNIYAGQTVSGEVTAIDDDTISMTPEGEADAISFTINDGVKITREGMGQPPEMSGDDSSDIPLEMPDGDAPSENVGQSGDNNSDSNMNTPPEKPAGDAPSENVGQSGDNNSDSNTNTPPEKPAGDAPSENVGQSGDNNSDSNTNTPPEKPDGDDPSDNGMPQDMATSTDASLSDIQVGDTIQVTFDDDGTITAIVITNGNAGGGAPGQPGGGNAGGVESYDAVSEYTTDTDIDGETYESTGTDENAIHVYEGANVTLNNITVTRSSEESSGGDNASFYGVGAAILTTDGQTTISNSTITTDANGAAGAFAYGDGTVYISDSTIKTTGDTAGGIHAAGGGTLYAWDLDVETNGNSSAAIRSDRGGGTMVVDGGTYTSNGTGSPAVYSTADIAINDATLTANGSEAVCIEGLNSLRLFGSNLTGNMSDDSQNDCTWNVILYQSMSGDSEVGNSTFEMDGGSLTAKNGGMFYTTNTESTFILNDVDITYAADNDFFLRCTGNNNQRGWGTSGANGADCNFTAIDQNMEGDVIWDSISKLDFYMTGSSTLIGAITDDETYAGNGGDGCCNVYIEKGSTWTVTGDSTLTKLSCAGTITDADGNTVTIVGTDGTVYVQGTSSYTITVDSYSTSVDTSDAESATNFSDYAVTQP